MARPSSELFSSQPSQRHPEQLVIRSLFTTSAILVASLVATIATPVFALQAPQALPSDPGTLDTIGASTDDTPMGASMDEGSTLENVTSVSQLSDVKPTDWAFQALQSLVERYGCIAGYPNKTYRGNRATTRYEFAAGLNSCMDRINDLVAASTADMVKKEDLATLRKLQDQYSAELATLRGQIDGLESRVGTLEKQQFSTTTKLFGQVILGLQGRTGNKATTPNSFGVPVQVDPGSGITMGYSANLSLVTAFSPKSILLVGLQAGNLTARPAQNYDVGLSYESNTLNQLLVSDVTYRQMLGRNLAVIVGAEGLNAVSVFRGANRVESAGSGPISALAQRNPIVSLGAGRAGLGLDWQIAPRVSLQTVYSAGNASNPTAGNGLLNGDYSLGAQLTLAPTFSTDLAIQYINTYTKSGFSNMVGEGVLAPGFPTMSNAIGASAAWRINSELTLGGWTGYTRSTAPGLTGGVDTFNWMAYLNLPDFGGRGNLAGLYVGQPPRITSSDFPSGLNIPGIDLDGLGASGGRSKATTHIEAFYRMQVSDRISITPGFMVILNPAGSNSETITVGAIRTTFNF